MSNTYIKFQNPSAKKNKTPDNIGKKLVTGTVDEIIPVANPDFAAKIGQVHTWLIEFEADSYYPDREIGLDESGKPIMIMPWKKNYGYWTDNNLLIADFRKNFETANILRTEFESCWKLFESENK